MSDLPPSEPLVPVPADAAANTHCTAADYDRLYAHSVDDPDAFWASMAIMAVIAVALVWWFRMKRWV